MLKKLTAFLTAAVMVTSVASIPVLTSYADTNSTTEKRVMEKLDRGTVAVKTNGGVYLSWRLLGTESLTNQAFDIYRDSEKIYTTGEHDATCYTDSKGTADNKSLGDWFVNTDKLPGSLKGLSEKVDKLGMSFGLWVEPEMISEDSDLFRKHPDWALRIQGREMHEGRNQYVLDMGRDDVVAYLTDVFTAVLGSADIKYINGI